MSLTAETTCSRCGGTRWIPGDPADDYVCLRCRCALAGGRVQDPLVTATTRHRLAPQRNLQVPEDSDHGRA